MPLITLGINHKTAPVSVRERVAFSPETTPAALKSLLRLDCVDEAAIVSTCNRTELYVCIESHNHYTVVVDWLADFHKLPTNELQDYLYQHPETDTVQHILRVASGIDSLILGEPQILGQLKDAYRYAREAGSVGTLLGRLFEFSFRVAKQIRTDTAIGSSPVSVAFAAVRLAKQIFGKLSPHTVLLIGAGETIELAARHLHEQGIGRLIVANRTIARAHELASTLNGYAIGLNEIDSHLAEADIIMSSTAAKTTLLHKQPVMQALHKRKHKPVFMVDLAVPRDIEASIGTLDDVYLYTIDDLHGVIHESMQSRQQAATQAEEIIDVQVSHFLAWKKSLAAADTIREIREQACAIKQQVLEKARQQLAAGKSPEQIMELLAHTLTNKLTHSPSVTLREAGSQGRTELIETARELFNIMPPDKQSPE